MKLKDSLKGGLGRVIEHLQPTLLMNNTTWIKDVTLRDGEQCPGAAMNAREKLEIAFQLARLKVDGIQAGFPGASPEECRAVAAIARSVRGPLISAFARCTKSDILKAGKAVKPAGARGQIDLVLATSPIHRKRNLKKDKPEILAMARRAIRHARRYVKRVQIYAEDATRTELEFLVEFCRTAIDAGATAVAIPDTIGRAVPEEYGGLFRELSAAIPEFQSRKVLLVAHCHDDLGNATSNTLAAIRNGAHMAECTVIQLGERAGNASLEEVVMNLVARPEAFGHRHVQVETRELLRTARLVSGITGFVIPRNRAIIGENAFATGAGMHQNALLKSKSTYQFISPRSVGWKRIELPLTKHSGRAAVSARLKHLGFKMVEGDVTKIFTRFKEIGDKKKFVYDEDLIALAEEMFGNDIPEVWKLDTLNYHGGSNGGSGVNCISIVSLRRKRKRLPIKLSEGNGPVTATFEAIKIAVGVSCRVIQCDTPTVSSGSDALVESVVVLGFPGKVKVTGKGLSTDSVEAAARAYLNAVNRWLANK